MFLRAIDRKKDGKIHTYRSVVENRRVARGRVIQRHVLYLGEPVTRRCSNWSARRRADSRAWSKHCCSSRGVTRGRESR